MNRLILFRNIPSTFGRALQRSQFKQEINVGVARKQHKNYMRALQSASNCPSIVFAADEEQPDCCFIEDCVVSLRPGVVLLTNPGANSRKGEMAPFRRFFHDIATTQNSRRLLRVEELEGDEQCDGGDLLRVGNRLFVGVGNRTNVTAFERLKDICADYDMSAVAIRVGASALHLKSLVTWLGEDIGFVAANNADGREAMRNILKKMPSSRQQNPQKQFLVRHPLAANMVRVDKTVFYAQGTDIERLQQRQRNIRFVSCNVSEINRADGALTCCSVCIELDCFSSAKDISHIAEMANSAKRIARTLDTV